MTGSILAAFEQISDGWDIFEISYPLHYDIGPANGNQKQWNKFSN